MTDPCYNKPSDLSVFDLRAKSGRWFWVKTYTNTKKWGWRVKKLEAHITQTSHVSDNDWVKHDTSIGVDSGRVAIVDSEQYESDNCDEDYDSNVFPYGVVSRSGFGDGSYDLFTHSNDISGVTSIRVVFI